MNFTFKNTVTCTIANSFHNLLVSVVIIITESMQVKKTLGITDTEKRYYNNIDQTETGSKNFWKIFLILFIILILIILFITCYRYIHRRVISILKSLIRQNEDNGDDRFSIIKEKENDSYEKRRFLGSNICNFSKFHVKYDGQRNKQYEQKCKLKTLLQEKKKLLAPCASKIETSTNNLTKQLPLKMFFPSFSSTHIKYKNISKTISNEWNIKDLEDYENICKNSHQNNKDICFSDTDLKFLVIPLSPTKSDIQNDELLLCKWNSGNINNSKKQNNVSSKLIDLKFENTDSFIDSTQKYKISTSKSSYSPYHLFTKNLTDSEYFSDSAADMSNILSNAFFNKLKRSTNSYTSSTLSNRSNAIKIGIDQILQVNSKIKNCSIYNSVKINTVNRDNLKELKSQINLNEHNGYLKKKEKRMKSSIDILRYEIKEAREKILKTDKNFIGTSLMKNNCKNSIIEQTVLEQLICNNHICISSDNTSEISETYDELGILFSQYIKLQTQLCQRKYCPLKRYLKHKVQHTTRKCQTKFNYSRIYPYDQRPTCNNGNICIDTYDELKLMCTTPTRRKDIYRCMFKRRKHILNQPCIISNQNFATVE